MRDTVDNGFRNLLRQMTREERRVFLRAVLRARAHCPLCPVISPGLHRDPCFGCIVMPNGLGQPTSTVN